MLTHGSGQWPNGPAGKTTDMGFGVRWLLVGLVDSKRIDDFLANALRDSSELSQE